MTAKDLVNDIIQLGDRDPLTVVDMRVNLGGLLMANPVTVASGTFGNGKQYSEFYPLNRLGAITTKGVSCEPWTGNDNPRIAETAVVCLIQLAYRILAWNPSSLRNCLGLPLAMSR